MDDFALLEDLFNERLAMLADAVRSGQEGRIERLSDEAEALARCLDRARRVVGAGE